MFTKKSFIALSLIILITNIFNRAEAACKPYNKLSEEEKNRIDGTGNYSMDIRQLGTNSVYDISGILAGSAEGYVYRYYGGTDWRIVSPDLGGSVLCMIEYQNIIYAGTRDGKVWKASPGTGIWSETMFPSGQEPVQVNALFEYRGELYAGTGRPYSNLAKLFRLSQNGQWELITTADGFYGIRSLYVYQDILFLGDITDDIFGHYDGEIYVWDGYFGVSCIWDFQEYHNRLYASSFEGDIYRLQEPLPDSSEKFIWQKIRQPDSSETWELEKFRDLLYVSHNNELLTYNGNNFSGPVAVIPDENQIIAMLTCKNEENLLIGIGQEMGGDEGYSGSIGKIYLYNGTELTLISGEIGAGIQCFLDTGLTLQLVKYDDVNNGDCVYPGREINYTIDYNYPAGPNRLDNNDVNIIDYLPDGVDFNSASNDWSYDSISHTVMWNLGTLSPGSSGFVTLKVKVKCAQPGGTITNHCEIRSSGQFLNSAYEHTNVCSAPTLTKVNNISGCVNPDDDVNYTICYTANGYGDTNVVLIDLLPSEVSYVSSDPCGTYEPENHRIMWNIPFLPDACGCITLSARVNHNVIRGGTITNYCELNGNCLDVNAHITNIVCTCWGPIYVDINATDGNNGYSWEDAYANLQDALKAAKDFNCNEILVAQGIYKPDVNSAYPNGSGSRESTFQFINGVSVYGGFPSGGGTWEQRNPAIYETILSGDLKGNDECGCVEGIMNDPSRADNSYHVVTGSGITQTTILDGFTITGGNSDNTILYNYGGGMYISNGSPTIRNCKFRYNSAYEGGGIYNSGEPNILNCLFIKNMALYGGGMSTKQAIVTNCTFTKNFSDGLYLHSEHCPGCDPNVKITNCILWGNETGQITGGLGNTSVNYSDIEGELNDLIGIGNINKDPMFGADGWHLSMGSPCIDVGSNTPPGGLLSTDIDNESRIMNGDCNGNSIVDMGADEYSPDCNALSYANNPQPISGTMTGMRVGKPLPYIKLAWKPGVYAISHNVYFGTNANNLPEINIVTEPNISINNLNIDTQYFWRVDETDGINIWQGPVWSFTLGNYLVVDDFDYYTNSEDMNVYWETYFTNNCYGDISHAGLSWDNYNGKKVMRFTYDNTEGVKYSEARFIANNGNGADWTGGTVIPDINILSISYHGAPENSADPTYDRLYTALEDTTGNFYVKSISDANATRNEETTENFCAKSISDANATRNSGWKSWNIALSALGVPTLDLTHVKYLYLGSGDRIGCNIDLPGGTGTVLFDDIRLYHDYNNVPVYCPNLLGDFTNDCRVDIYDLDYFADGWLMTNANITLPISNPDINGLSKVWYKFDDTAGTTVYDVYHPEANNATVLNPGLESALWSTSAGFDGSGCINLVMNAKTLIEIPPAVLNFLSTKNAMTISMWIKADEYAPYSGWPRLISIWEPNVGDIDQEIVEIECPTPLPNCFTNGPAVRMRWGQADSTTTDDNRSKRMPFDNFAGRWNHYAFIKDTDVNIMRVYCNGYAVVENTNTQVAMPSPPLTSFRIGCRIDSLYEQHWVGSIDDFKVYDRALSPEEIAYIGTRGTGIYYVPFDSILNLYTADEPPRRINFRDFSVMANHWLEQTQWP